MPAVETQQAIQFIHANRFQNNYVALSTKQQQIDVMSAPAIVNGIAGSGKTLIGSKVLDEKVLESEDKHFLYIAPNQSLTKSMKRDWQQKFEGVAHSSTVDFITFDELLEKKSDAGEYEFFTKWLEHYSHKAKIKQDEQTAEIVKNAQQIFQEFRIISGYDREQYLTLGKRQSTYSKEYRQWLHDAYQNYIEYLKENDKQFSAHATITTDKAYDFVVVDELQAFSFGQIKQIAGLAKDGQLLALLDTNQALCNIVSSRNYLETMLHDQGFEFSELPLEHSYRYPAVVGELVEEVQQVRNAIFGGKTDKSEAKLTMGDDKPGQLYWTEQLSNRALTEQLSSYAQRPGAIIITSEAFIDEARKKFNTEIVLTPEQAAGLEGSCIIVYRLLDDPRFAAMSKKLRSLEKGKMPANLPKQAHASEDYELVSAASSLFLALTRTTRQAIVLQQKSKELESLLEAMPSLAKNNDKEQLLEDLEFNMDWEKFISYLFEQGQEKTAIKQMQLLGWSQQKIDELMVSCGFSVEVKPKPQQHKKPAQKPKKQSQGGKKGKATNQNKKKKKQTLTPQQHETRALINNFYHCCTTFIRRRDAKTLLLNEGNGKPLLLTLLEKSGNQRFIISTFDTLPKVPQNLLVELMFAPLKNNATTAFDILRENSLSIEQGLGLAAFKHLVLNHRDKLNSFKPKTEKEYQKFFETLATLPEKELMDLLLKDNQKLLSQLINSNNIEAVTLLATFVKKREFLIKLFSQLDSDSANNKIIEIYKHIQERKPSVANKLYHSDAFVELILNHPELLFLKNNSSESFFYRLAANDNAEILAKLFSVVDGLANQIDETILLENPGENQGTVVSHLFYRHAGLCFLRQLIDNNPGLKHLLKEQINAFAEQSFNMSAQDIIKALVNDAPLKKAVALSEFNPESETFKRPVNDVSTQQLHKAITNKLTKEISTQDEQLKELINYIASVITILWHALYFKDRKQSNYCNLTAIEAKLLAQYQFPLKRISYEVFTLDLNVFILINRDTTSDLSMPETWGAHTLVYEHESTTVAELSEHPQRAQIETAFTNKKTSVAFVSSLNPTLTANSSPETQALSATNRFNTLWTKILTIYQQLLSGNFNIEDYVQTTKVSQSPSGYFTKAQRSLGELESQLSALGIQDSSLSEAHASLSRLDDIAARGTDPSRALSLGAQFNPHASRRAQKKQIDDLMKQARAPATEALGEYMNLISSLSGMLGKLPSSDSDSSDNESTPSSSNSGISKPM